MSDEKIITKLDINGHDVTMAFNVEGDTHNSVVVMIRSDKQESEPAFMDMIDRLGDLMYAATGAAQRAVTEERA